MTPSAATPPSPIDSNPDDNSIDVGVAGPAAFGQLLHTALRERARAGTDVGELLASGELIPQALCRYAAGRLAGPERDELEGYLSRTPWAQSRVSALVLGSRADAANPLAGRILAEVTAKSPPELDHDSSTNQLIQRVRKLRRSS